MKYQLNEETVKHVSSLKAEPSWMLDLRMMALRVYHTLPMPRIDRLNEIDFQKLRLFHRSHQKTDAWGDLPNRIRQTFIDQGIDSQNRNYDGTTAQLESEAVFSNLRDEYKKKGVIHTDTDTAVKEYPELVKKYFNSVIPYNDHKIAALSYAFWSGGSFVFVPEGVNVTLPVHAVYNINSRNFGQFEHTIVVAKPNSVIHCIEGCTSPVGTDQTLHAGVVEMIIGDNARVKYSTIQNWSKNVYNLVTKRAVLSNNAQIKWVDCNFGSKFTYKKPTVLLNGENSSAEIVSLSVAGSGQTQDCGARVVHNGSNTSSVIISKSVSQKGGGNIFQGSVEIKKNATNASSHLRCDSIILDNQSTAQSLPCIISGNDSAQITHEATISSIDRFQLFYLQSRGFSERQAISLIINGFTADFIDQFPLYYAKRIKGILDIDL